MIRSLVLCSALMLALPAHGQDAPLSHTRHVIVSATGEAERVPDTAIMSFAVVTEDQSAAEAFHTNNEAANRLVEGLKQLDIEDRHIATRNISIQPRYDYSRNNGEEPRLIGYTAENQVEVRFTSLEGLGAKLDKVVDLGANRVSGPSFIVSDPVEAQAEARRKALENAMEKARTYADAGGFELGEILQIEEAGSSMPIPRPMMMRSDAKMEAAPAPIEAGSTSLSVDVTVKFAIR